MDENHAVVEFYHPFDVLDTRQNGRRPYYLLGRMFHDAADRIDRESDRTSRRAGNEELIAKRRAPLRQAKAPADVEDRDDPPLNIDNAVHDLRCLRQGGDLDHAHRSFHRREVQCVIPFIESKNNELTGYVHRAVTS